MKTQNLFLLPTTAGTWGKWPRDSPVQKATKITHQRGTGLESFLDQREDIDVLAPYEPTHFSNNKMNDVIDIVLICNLAMSHEITVTNEGSSEHNPVLLALGEKGD